MQSKKKKKRKSESIKSRTISISAALPEGEDELDIISEESESDNEYQLQMKPSSSEQANSNSNGVVMEMIAVIPTNNNKEFSVTPGNILTHAHMHIHFNIQLPILEGPFLEFSLSIYIYGGVCPSSPPPSTPPAREVLAPKHLHKQSPHVLQNLSPSYHCKSVGALPALHPPPPPPPPPTTARLDLYR